MRDSALEDQLIEKRGGIPPIPPRDLERINQLRILKSSLQGELNMIQYLLDNLDVNMCVLSSTRGGDFPNLTNKMKEFRRDSVKFESVIRGR